MSAAGKGHFRALKLFLLFTLLPAVELYLVLRIGGWLGAEATVALVVATGVLGAFMVARELKAALTTLKGLVESGIFPKEGLIHWVGSCLLVLAGGLLLLTPGAITDLAGLALVMPPIRVLLARRLGPLVERILVEEGVSPRSVLLPPSKDLV